MRMTNDFAVIDFETTSGDISDAHVIEWAAVAVGGDNGIEPLIVASGFVQPPIPIPPQSSAIHQIIDSDVAGYPAWDKELKWLSGLLISRSASAVADNRYTIAVAHNADFEQGILLRDNPALSSVPFICTYKGALRVWPDAPSHSNEGLRYWLGFGTGRSHHTHPHSAAHDAIVTAQILGKLLEVVSAETLLAWTKEPPLLPMCPLGKFFGYKWPDVETGFLQWIMRTIYDRPDVRFAAEKELDRRAEAYRLEQAELARRAAGDADLQNDIPF